MKFRRSNTPSFHERLLDVAPVSIWACDRHYRIVLWNYGAAATYGYSKDEALGRNYLDLFVQEDQRDESQVDCDSVIEDGAIFLCFIAKDEAKVEPADSSGVDDVGAEDPDRWMLTNCFRVTDDGGSPLQVEIAVDVSPISRQLGDSRSFGDLLSSRLDAGKDDIEVWKRELEPVIDLELQHLKLAAASRRASLDSISARELSLNKRTVVFRSKLAHRQALDEQMTSIQEELEKCRSAAVLVRTPTQKRELERRMAVVCNSIAALQELSKNFQE